MTQQQTTETAPESVFETTDETPTLDDQTETPEDENTVDEATEDEEPQNRSKEAQKLRKRLREAESERDAAKATADAMRSVILAHALDGQDLTAEALTAAGHDVGALVADDGTVDAGALATAITSTAERFGIRRSNTPLPDPSQGSHGNYLNGSTWENAFSADR